MKYYDKMLQYLELRIEWAGHKQTGQSRSNGQVN